jgi:hypothetical protein
MMLVSSPNLHPRTVTSFGGNDAGRANDPQILGLDPNSLSAVRKEGTPVLPGLDFED